MWFNREIAPILRAAFLRHPVLTLTGPRQSGKTSLVRRLFPDLPYHNLEDPRTREFATADPAAFLSQLEGGAVLDEIQQVPDLLSALQVVVDRLDRNGLFVLTGSYQMGLRHAIGQSLAGRTALHVLLPLSVREIMAAQGQVPDLDELLLRGFLPRVHAQNQLPAEAYAAYVATYLERDLRDLSRLHNLSRYRRFLELCAGRTAGLVNKSALASDVGVSAPTIEDWMSLLETVYGIVRLPPWFENLRKRLVRSPKLHFLDTGVACHLLHIDRVEQLKVHPLRGALFESMMASEALKARFNAGLASNLHHYRDSHGSEVDLLLQSGHEIRPIEVKSAHTFHPDFLRGINELRAVMGNRVVRPLVVLGGGQAERRTDVDVLPWPQAAAEL